MYICNIDSPALPSPAPSIPIPYYKYMGKNSTLLPLHPIIRYSRVVFGWEKIYANANRLFKYGFCLMKVFLSEVSFTGIDELRVALITKCRKFSEQIILRTPLDRYF